MPSALVSFRPPKGLEGQGLGGNLLGAVDDLQAVRRFLEEFQASPHTLRHYTKEVERFLLWMWIERQKTLAELTREDFILYQRFLADPRPRERWCGPRVPRHSPHWKPFTKGLSPRSIHTALIILHALMVYLVEGGYLPANPLALMRRRRPHRPQRVARFLDKVQWRAVVDTLEAMPRGPAYERMRFLLALLYLLAPRVGELEGHRMGDFLEIQGRWWWRVVGKGGRERYVPVNSDMLEALKRYRLSLGLPPLPSPEEDIPLLLSLDGKRPITARRLNQLLKALFLEASKRLEGHRAKGLRSASAHWMRHTSLSHQAEAGIGGRDLQRNAGHARFETTLLYLHREEEERHRAMEKHRFA